MTWLAGCLEVWVSWPQAHVAASSLVHFQVAADETGGFELITHPESLPKARGRRAVAQVVLHATSATDGALDVVMDVEARPRRRATLFLHDEFRLSDGERVFSQEGDLKVTGTMGVCEDRAACRELVVCQVYL